MIWRKSFIPKSKIAARVMDLVRDQRGMFCTTALCGFMAFTPAAAASSYIVSIQPFNITIASGSTSNTATISSVTTANAVIFPAWCEGSDASNTQRTMGWCTLTNGTTVTANRGSGTAGTCNVKGTVVEFISAAIAVGAQYGQITITSTNSSNTATISSVNTANAICIMLGQTTTSGGISSSVFCTTKLTSATQVTATRTGTSNTATVSFVVVEFATAVVASVQHVSTSSSNTATTFTQAISAVNTSRTLIFWNGLNSSATSPSTICGHATLTSSTQITMTRNGTAGSTRSYELCVLEFQSGVLNSLQSGTTTMTGVASNTSTISSVTTSKSVVVFGGWLSSTAGTTAMNDVMCNVTLTNATTVTVNRNGSTSNVTESWQVPEFI